MKRLYYIGQPDDGYGWGLANCNIVKALGEFCEVIVDGTSKRFDGPAFVPVSDSKLNPLRKVKAKRIIGYCFTEWPIHPDAHRNARMYDVLFAGSTWNVQRLAAHRIKAEVLHQGIDFERFKVQPPSERKGFVVFSGGKYEFRKGHDYVVAAMRHFMHVHEDVVLLAAWHNQWPQSMASMGNSWLIDDWQQPFKDLPKERVIEVPKLRNYQTPALYAQAHIGLFPNRCEAGTNLVMCEFMACGRPVIATNATGHRDVFNSFYGVGPYLLKYGTMDAAGWFNANVSDIIATLENAYQNRELLATRAQVSRKLVERFTWRDCAWRIYQAAFPGPETRQPAPASPQPALA